MARKRTGSKHHLKRLVAPAWWPIPRKVGGVWTVKPSPGPHPITECLPLLIVVRDVLKYAKTYKEARKLIAEGHFKVDGRVVRNYKFPLGLMDVLSIEETGEYYRLVPHPVKYLTLHPISKEEAGYKLCRIENKTSVKGGHIQLNLHDGRNHLIKCSKPFKPPEDVFKTYDVIKLAIPKQEILDYYKLEVGAFAVVCGGRNVGIAGRIKSIKQIFKKCNSVVELETPSGNIVRTILKYIFVVGREKPEISLPEEVLKA